MVLFRRRKDSQTWITAEIHHLIHKRSYYRRKYQRSRDPVDWECYKHSRNKVIQIIRQAKREYMLDVCKDFSKNPRKAWIQMNTPLGRKVKGSVITLKHDGRSLINTKEIVTTFNNYFSSCITPSSTSELPSFSNTTYQHPSTL